MQKLVVAEICLLLLMLSVTTGSRCVKEERTRTGKKCSQQQLRRVDKALSRAGDIPEGSWICLSHRSLILAEDKRCSCPSSWGHGKSLSKVPIPDRLYRVFDEVGRNSVTEYKPGSNWCTKCRVLADKEFASHPMFTPRKQKKVTSENKVKHTK